MGKVLDGYPTWSQNADPEPNGTSDPFALTDCGEECCSIVEYALVGKYTTAGAVRRAMPGHSDHGETTPDDLVQYLTSVGCLPIARGKMGAELRPTIRRTIERGAPCIVLGHYVSPIVLHWVVVVGYGNDHVFYIDPWYGRLEARHWAVFLPLSTGDLVVVDTRRTMQ